MKRFILIITVISLAWVVSLVSCANNSIPKATDTSSDIPTVTETDAPETNSPETNDAETVPPTCQETYITAIVDRAERDMIPTDTALELLWQDEFCDYYFPTIRSEYVVVEYSDGSEIKVKDALEAGIITIENLDECNIQYIKSNTREPAAHECTVESISVNDESTEKTSPYAVLFHTDEEYMYFYSRAAYEVTVKYTNGYSELLYSALERATVTFEVLDESEVEYFKVSHENFGKCGVREVVDLEALGYMKNEFPGGMSDDTFDVIYEDENFYYELHTPYEAAIIVVYNDGTTERIKDALKAGRASVSDLEESGISFDAIPKVSRK